MQKITESAKRLDGLAEDYRLACLAVQSAKSEAGEITEAINARLQQEESRNAERREALKAVTEDRSRSEVVQKMAGLELEALERQAPEATQAETALFDAKIKEGEAALVEAKKIELQLQTARSDLKKLLDSDFKLTSIFPIDTTLLSRQLEGTKEAFKRQHEKRGQA